MIKDIPKETPWKMRKWAVPAWDVNYLNGGVGMDFSTSLGFNESQFMKQYFGRFLNRDQDGATPRLIFRNLVIRGGDRYSPTELNRLIHIVHSNRNGSSVGGAVEIKDGLAHHLFECIRREEEPKIKEEKEIEKKMLNYLSLVLKKDVNLCQRIRVLDTTGIETFPSLINMIISLCPNIEHASFGTFYQKRFYRAKIIKLNEIAPSIATMKNLKTFRWLGHGFADAVESLLVEISKHTPLLENLVVSSETSLVCCHKALLNWKHLKLIVSQVSPSMYSQDHGSIEDQTQFFDSISQLDKLEKLCLVGCIINSQVVLKHELPPSLTCLNLDRSTFPSDNLLRVVGKLPNLRVLGLDCYYGERDSLNHLIGLKDTLTELYITQSSSCGDVGVKIISQISSLKKLMLLNLNQDPISDEGAAELVNLKNLEVLDLQYSNISHKTINRIVESSPKIKKICIEGCHGLKKRKLVQKASLVIVCESFDQRILNNISL